MITSIDHVVILVSDLAAAVADYTTLGFTVVPGGEHTGGATHNALVAFADGSYLELIAFKRAAPDHRWWRHVAAGEGLIDFALLPTAIAADLAAAAERGLTIGGPFDGGRLRPDGQQIAWQTGQAETPDLPFLCADLTPRSLRVPSGAAWDHANGAVGIEGLTVAVADLDASAARYQALLGAALTPDLPPGALPAAHTAAFRVGAAIIGLATPAEGPAGDPELRAQLAARGEGLYALALRAGRGEQPVALDTALAHGARIVLA